MQEKKAPAVRVVEPETLEKKLPVNQSSSGLLKLALLTVASVLAGGVATAWFYRKTLAKLRETGENPKNPHFGISNRRRARDGSDEI
jgi:hypothetical protein